MRAPLSTSSSPALSAAAAAAVLLALCLALPQEAEAAAATFSKGRSPSLNVTRGSDGKCKVSPDTIADFLKKKLIKQA